MGFSTTDLYGYRCACIYAVAGDLTYAISHDSHVRTHTHFHKVFPSLNSWHALYNVRKSQIRGRPHDERHSLTNSANVVRLAKHWPCWLCDPMLRKSIVSERAAVKARAGRNRIMKTTRHLWLECLSSYIVGSLKAVLARESAEIAFPSGKIYASLILFGL